MRAAPTVVGVLSCRLMRTRRSEQLDNEQVTRTGRARYRDGLLLGSVLTFTGIMAALALSHAAAPLLIVAGWLVIAWSTHRMGRSGPASNLD
jgi:hypothetical protein